MKKVIKIIKRYLPIIGILLFIYILIKMGISQIFNEIINARLDFLFISFSFVLIACLTETLKWFVIARKQKIEVSFIEAIRINFISSFYGFITPSKIGSVIRANYLKKYANKKLGKGISNFVLDKILDICSLVFIVIFFSFVFRKIISISLLYYSIAILLFLSISLFIFLDKNRSKSILRIFYRKLIPNKFKKKTKESFYSFYENIPKKRDLAFFFFLNVLNYVVAYTATFFIGLSVGINISLFYFFAILPIGTLVGQIPITISGLGTREATLISLFGFLGVKATKVFSMSLIGIFIGGIFPAIIGSLLIFIGKKNKKSYKSI